MSHHAKMGNNLQQEFREARHQDQMDYSHRLDDAQKLHAAQIKQLSNKIVTLQERMYYANVYQLESEKFVILEITGIKRTRCVFSTNRRTTLTGNSC